jgi:uncharacterized delta-60 repeat protein
MVPIVRRGVLLVMAVFLLVLPVRVWAQTPGQLDPAFDAGFIDFGFGSSEIRTVVRQPDGKILVGGAFSAIAGATRHAIARLNVDGTVDATFVSPFSVGTQVPLVIAMALQPDGRILVGGNGLNVGGQNRFLVRLLADGSLDPSFTVLPMNASAGVEAITLLADGRFYIGGDYGSIGAVTTRTLTRMLADGTVDPSFAINAFLVSGRALSIVVQPDGQVVAGGDYFATLTSGGPTYGYLMRFSSTGVVDTTFDPMFSTSGIVPSVKSVVRSPDGTFYAGGVFGPIDGAAGPPLVRFSAAGDRIPAFAPGIQGFGDVHALALDASGRLLVTGNLYFPGTGPSNERRHIARLDPVTGAFDAFYPANGLENMGNALAVQPDGKVIVAGRFFQVSGVDRWRIARLLDTVNTPPVAVGEAYTTSVNLPLIVPAPGVLGNDTDAESNPLTAQLTAGPASGSLALAANGSFTFTPAPGFAGTVSFTYVALDAVLASAPATVSIAVLPPMTISAITGTPFPGGTGTFTGFLGGPAVSGAVTAFHAAGTSGQQALIVCDRAIPTDPCRSIVSLATPIPGGSGAFTSLGQVTVAGRLVAFAGGGAGQAGVFVCDRLIPTDPCTPLAALTTAIPGGTGSFTGFGDLALATGTALTMPPPLAGFIGSGAGQQGVFLCDRAIPTDPCRPVATLSTAIPGGSGTFTAFQRLAVAPDTAAPSPRPFVAFIGTGAGTQGVFRCDASAIPTDPCQPVATLSTAIPGGAGTFTGFTQLAAAGRVTVFAATGSGGQAGVYRCDTAIPTDPCQPVATRASLIPSGTGTFTGFDAVSTSHGHTAFLGLGVNGQAGIYVASVPQKVIAVGDALAGRIVAELRFGRDGLDGTHLTFGARFTDGSEGVFVADLPQTYLLSEGSTGSFFDLDVLIANPNTLAAPITVRFLKDDGSVIVQNLTVAATSQRTLHVDQIAGLEGTAVSTEVTSNAGLPLVVERSMFWDSSYYGSHGATAVDGPHAKWYFAEGSEGFFSTFLLLANASAQPATVTVSFLTERAGTIVRTYAVAPTARLTVAAGLIPELVHRSFAIVVDSSVPIVAERAMYFGTARLWDGGHESMGVFEPSANWFLAEGATGSYFDTFILVANPNPTPATVTMTFLTDQGQSIVRTFTVAANARLTVNMEEQAAVLANAAASTTITANVPIIIERAMYWPGNGLQWSEAHNSFGVTGTSTTWGLAEGRVGTDKAFATYILLANPSTTTAAQVRVTYLRTSGAPIVKTYAVNPTSRFNIDVNSRVPELVNESFGALIEVTNGVGIVVERSLYNNALGQVWAAGTNALGTRLP